MRVPCGYGYFYVTEIKNTNENLFLQPVHTMFFQGCWLPQPMDDNIIFDGQIICCDACNPQTSSVFTDYAGSCKSQGRFVINTKFNFISMKPQTDGSIRFGKMVPILKRNTMVIINT
jgi:hypothetical protein